MQNNELKKFAKQKGFGIKKLAELTGMSRPTISRHFNGRRVPDRDQRELYARAMRVSVDAIDAIIDPEIHEGKSCRLILPLPASFFDRLKAMAKRGNIPLDELAFDLLKIGVAATRSEKEANFGHQLLGHVDGIILERDTNAVEEDIDDLLPSEEDVAALMAESPTLAQSIKDLDAKTNIDEVVAAPLPVPVTPPEEKDEPPKEGEEPEGMGTLAKIGPRKPWGSPGAAITPPIAAKDGEKSKGTEKLPEKKSRGTK